jgi:hypothetical protein
MFLFSIVPFTLPCALVSNYVNGVFSIKNLVVNQGGMLIQFLIRFANT